MCLKGNPKALEKFQEWRDAHSKSPFRKPRGDSRGPHEDR
jgi:hypothetical protein